MLIKFIIMLNIIIMVDGGTIVICLLEQFGVITFGLLIFLMME